MSILQQATEQHCCRLTERAGSVEHIGGCFDPPSAGCRHKPPGSCRDPTSAGLGGACGAAGAVPECDARRALAHRLEVGEGRDHGDGRVHAGHVGGRRGRSFILDVDAYGKWTSSGELSLVHHGDVVVPRVREQIHGSRTRTRYTAVASRSRRRWMTGLDAIKGSVVRSYPHAA